MIEPTSPAISRLPLPPKALAGKVVVISGGGRGIGRAMVRAFAGQGATVIIAEIADSGSETEQIVAAEGGLARFIRTDVSNEESITALARQVSAAYGLVDILINNAILCPAAGVLEMDVALWDRVMAVNLRGTFLMCRAFLPQMIARMQGTLINMISTDAMPYLSAYIASKAGIAAFTQSLAGEVGEKGLRVIAFAPGFVDTPGLRAAAEGLAPHMGISVDEFMKIPFHPAYPNGMPAEDAAAAAVYLATALADEFHAEQVTGYTVLERAGLIQPAAPDQSLPVKPDFSAGVGAAALPRALDRSQKLLKVIADTDAEFNKLPVFVRPLARQGFKAKSGQSVQEWKRSLEALLQQLERAVSGGEDAGLRASLPRLRQLLGKLNVYYRDVPAETGRFTKDTALLAEVQRITNERMELIRDLLLAIEME